MSDLRRGYVGVSRSFRSYRVGEACVSSGYVFCDSFRFITNNLRTGFIVKVKKILECICVNCGRLKADIVSRVSLSSTRFAPLYPTFWGLSPNPWRTPSPLCVSSRQSRRSSTRDVDCARFRSLDRRAVHCITSGVGWTRGCVVKWGAERGVRKNRSTAWSSHAGMFGQPALAVTQLERHGMGLHILLNTVLPPVVVQSLPVSCLEDTICSRSVAHADVLPFMYLLTVVSLCELAR